MKYADIIDNDVVNGEGGVCVSVWMAGCPHRCKGCHNPELWDSERNKDILEVDFFKKLEKLIEKNNIIRNLSILGGEPLYEENLLSTTMIVDWYKKKYPNNRIFLWTGYEQDELDEEQQKVCDSCHTIIYGRYEEDKRDVRLRLRGSYNQTIVRKN